MKVGKTAELLYSSYLIYLTILWTAVNFGGSGSNPYTGQGMRWFLITIPLLLVIFVWLLLWCRNFSIKKDESQILLLLYMLCIIPISLVHVDLKHFSEVLRWALPLYLLIHFRVSIPYQLLNLLYLVALAVVVIGYRYSGSDFGFLPGQSTTNLHQGLWWRVSIWNYMTPPYSAAFSMVVLIVNYFYNRSPFRYIFYILCGYFILLSASRTTYFIVAVTVFYVLLEKKVTLRLRWLYLALPFAIAASIFILQIYSELAAFTTSNEFVNSAITRSAEGGAQETLDSRLLIIAEHYRLLANSGLNPVFGIGSLVNNSPNWTSNGGFLGGTTDSLISHLIARDGVAFIFLLSSYVLLVVKLLKEHNSVGYLNAVILLVYTVAYGAWMNFSSPVFVMYCSLFFIDDRYKLPIALEGQHNA